jgi:hypothetical protein
MMTLWFDKCNLQEIINIQAISSPDLVTQNLMSTSERNLPSNTTGPTSRHVHNSGFNYHGFQV